MQGTLKKEAIMKRKTKSGIVIGLSSVLQLRRVDLVVIA
jgi:hypothetical protein